MIRVMPEGLANKIAAGEVVQRPASAAKELIENALDAGADDITVRLKSAGRDLIQIIDNGCGMGREDARASFVRHATSKIRSVEDLERIFTLGFRGEALASIAAVSQVELRTKRMQDEAGFCVRMDGGHLVSKEPCATPNGTSVSVKNLFYNVPARRNFLKSQATEFKHLVETFQFLALSFPKVGFSLMHDENEVYRLSASESENTTAALRRRIGALFGKKYETSLIRVEETTSYLSAIGFVGSPEIHRRRRGEQFLFVNGRYVKNRYLDHAVSSAYERSMPEGSFPFFALFIDLDPRHVDVNVHPTKAEVKFDDDRGVYGFLKAVVQKALGTANLTPRLDRGFGLADSETGPVSVQPFSPVAPDWLALSTDEPRMERATTDYKSTSPGALAGIRAKMDPSPNAFSESSSASLSSSDLERPVDSLGQLVESGATVMHVDSDVTSARSTLLWQLHEAYILTQIHSGLLLVDQNAAHERILYERAIHSLEDEFGLSQQLLFPHTLDCDPVDHKLLEELLPDLHALGFDLELLSGRTVMVRGVPADIRTGDERAMLEDVIEQYKMNLDRLRIPERDNLARSISRRSAIKQGVKMSTKEMRTLIDQLFLCKMPYHCPDGRPTMIRLTLEELEHRFRR